MNWFRHFQRDSYIENDLYSWFICDMFISTVVYFGGGVFCLPSPIECFMRMSFCFHYSSFGCHWKITATTTAEEAKTTENCMIWQLAVHNIKKDKYVQIASTFSTQNIHNTRDRQIEGEWKKEEPKTANTYSFIWLAVRWVTRNSRFSKGCQNKQTYNIIYG